MPFPPRAGPRSPTRRRPRTYTSARARHLFSPPETATCYARLSAGRSVHVRPWRKKKQRGAARAWRGVVERDPHTYYDVVVVVALQARHRPVHCTMLLRPHRSGFSASGDPRERRCRRFRRHRYRTLPSLAARLGRPRLAQASLYRSAVQLKQTHQPDYRYHIISYHIIGYSQPQQAAKVRLSPCMGRAQESRRGKLPYALRLRAWKTKESRLERSRRQNDGAT